MIDELLDYIFRSVPPERGVLYKDTLKLLQQIDPQVMELLLSNFAGNAEDFDTAMNVNSFHSLLINNVSDQIEQFSVYLNDDADYYHNLPLLYAILNSLYLVERYDNMGELKVLLDEGLNARETVGQMLNAIDSKVTLEGFCEMVQDVSPTLLARINEMVAERTQFDFDDTTTPDEALRQRAREAVKFYQVEGMTRYFEEGGNLGEPFGRYLDYFYHELQTVATDHAARMFLACAVFAGLTDVQAEEEIALSLTTVFADMPADRLLSQGRALKKVPRMGVSNEEA